MFMASAKAIISEEFLTTQTPHDVVDGSKPDDHEARLGIANELIETLREAGYRCELAIEALH
jgi:hypothetical protein